LGKLSLNRNFAGTRRQTMNHSEQTPTIDGPTTGGPTTGGPEVGGPEVGGPLAVPDRPTETCFVDRTPKDRTGGANSPRANSPPSLGDQPVGPTARSTALIDQLRKKIRKVETAGRLDNGGNVVTHGCAAVDRLLPERGYSRGTLVQWIAAAGHGADFLSLMVAQRACEDGGALVVIDPQNEFFPRPLRPSASISTT
jgi:hypothetical protein